MNIKSTFALFVGALVLSIQLSTSSAFSYQEKDQKETAKKAPDAAQASKQDPKGEAKQDAKSTEKKSEPAKQDDKPQGFAEVMNEWVTLEGKFKALEAEFKIADEARKEKIKEEYKPLLETAKKVAKDLRAAAIKNYEEAPNQNPAVLRVLIGMLTDDLANRRTEDFFRLGDVLIKGKVNVEHFQALHKSRRLVAKRTSDGINELLARYRDVGRGDLPQAVVKTSYGDIVIELYEDDAPNHVANFIHLAKDKKYYTNSAWHRVEPSVNVVQGGKAGEGIEEMDYTIADESLGPESRLHFKGAVGMAKTQAPHSASSQFYIMTDDFPAFDNRYTVFGRVISGMDAVLAIKPDDKILSVEITRDRGHKYEPKKYDPDNPVVPTGDKKGTPEKSTDEKKTDIGKDGTKGNAEKKENKQSSEKK